MGLEDVVGTVVLAGGALYVLDKMTGKRKRIVTKSEIKKRAKRATKPKKYKR
jgi:hypothetical protein